MSACEAPGTVPLVSRTSPAAAFQFDAMPKITTATPAATATATATATPTLVRAATTVKIENKWPAAEAAAFSYQRAAKQIGAIAPTRRQSLETGIGEIALPLPLPLPLPSTTTTTTTTSLLIRQPISIPIKPPPTGDNPCEQQFSSNLALRKAQLKAAFFASSNQQPERAVNQTLATSNSLITPYRRIRARTEARKPVQQLIDQYQAMIVQQEKQQQQVEQQQQQQQQVQMMLSEPKSAPGAIASNSDEGCNVTGSGLSPYSSDGEDVTTSSSGKLSPRQRKLKVTRCASSDSALGLEVDDASMDVCAPSMPPQRRMTLTVTDLPLRPALLPLAEPTALPDSPLTSPTGSVAAAGGAAIGGGISVPTKVLLEERVVAAPGSRRESTQSSYSELGSSGFPLGVRYVRTPSVVVSDYSDDITACGISMEEMEYFRLQRARCQRRCSLEAGHGHGHHGAGGTGSGAGGMSPGCAKDEGQSDVSAASSCSNLYYCGSTISALDGGECIVNGIRVALARKSSTQSSSLSGEEEDDDDDDDEQERDLEQELEQEEYGRGDRVRERERERERERQLSELLAATQLGERQIRDRSKKVGARDDVTNQGNLKLD